MSKKRKTSRVAKLARRKAEQGGRKLTVDRDRLFALSPGGSAQHPLTVPSPSVIEGRARAMPCPQCQGSLIVDNHEVERETGQSLRRIQAHCGQCQAKRQVWFRIAVDGLN